MANNGVFQRGKLQQRFFSKYTWKMAFVLSCICSGTLRTLGEPQDSSASDAMDEDKTTKQATDVALEDKAKVSLVEMKEREKYTREKLERLRAELKERQKASLQTPKVYLVGNGFQFKPGQLGYDSRQEPPPQSATVPPSEHSGAESQLPSSDPRIGMFAVPSWDAPAVSGAESPQSAGTSPAPANRSSSSQAWQSSLLFMMDVQHLLLYAVEGNYTTYKPRWCRLLRPAYIPQVVVLELSGITKRLFVDHKDDYFTFIRDYFDMCVEVISPLHHGSTVMEEIFRQPLSRSQCYQYNLLWPKETETVKQKEKKKKKKLVAEFDRTSLVLSTQQLMQEGYPLPAHSALYADYVFSKEAYGSLTPLSPMYAIDCEMVKNGNDEMELAWIAIVNEDLKVVYESLVKPRSWIKDYLTKYSGITRERLANVATRIEDVHKVLHDIIPHDAILCGQSLNSDLKAMKVFHPYIIDTSVIFNLSGSREKKPSLKQLALSLLDKNIQCHGDQGHSPIEDATASMELVQLKLREGPAFGDVILGNEMSPQYFKNQSQGKRTHEGVAGQSENTDTPKRPKLSEPETQQGADDRDSIQDSAAESVEEDSTSSETVENGNVPENTECSHSSEDKDTDTTDKKTDQKKDNQASCFFTLGKHFYQTIFKLAKDANRTVAVSGPESALEPWRQEAGDDVDFLPAATAKQCARACRAAIDDHFLIWGQMGVGYENSHQEFSKTKLQKLNRSVQKVLLSCQKKTLVVVLLGGNGEETSDSNGLCFLKVT